MFANFFSQGQLFFVVRNPDAMQLGKSLFCLSLRRVRLCYSLAARPSACFLCFVALHVCVLLARRHVMVGCGRSDHVVVALARHVQQEVSAGWT